MKIGIVIIHWRDAEQTRKCLAHLLSWKNLDITIALVQNECTEDAFPDIKTSQLLKIIQTENLGFGGANNLGIDALENMDFSHIMLLNTDAKIEEQETIKLIQFAQKNEQLFSCGPKLNEMHEGKMKTYVGGLDISKNVITRLPYNPSYQGKISIDVDYNIGAIVLLNKQLLKQIGNFDQRYFFSGEMADLCFRAKQLSYTCKTLLTAEGFHFSIPSKARSTLYKYYSLRNRMIFIKKHSLGFKLKWNWYILAIKELMYQIVHLNKPQIKVISLSLLHMIFGVSGNRNKYFV